MTINKMDFIDPSTNMYDADKVSDNAGSNLQASVGLNVTPEDRFMDSVAFTGDDYQVAGLGSAFRRMSPERYRADKSVKELREDVLAGEGEGMPTMSDEERDLVVDHFQGQSVPPLGHTGDGPLTGRTVTRNVNLDYLDSPDAIKEVIDGMATWQRGNIDARRGVQPMEQTQTNAQNIDAIELITGWKPSTAWNPEQITAARQLLVDVSVNVRAQAQKLMKDPSSASDLDWANYAKMQRVLAAVNQTVSGATAEAGRTLNALKIPIEGNDRADSILSILETGGGRDLLRKQAELIAGLSDDMDPDQLSRSVNEAMGAPNQGVLAEIWVNGRLSSPVTHAVNITSNTFMQLYETFMVKPTAATIGAIRSMATGADDVISYEEVAAETFGMFSAFGEAIELFGQRIAQGGAGGQNLFTTPAKHEMTAWNAFSQEKLLPNSMQGGSMGRAVDLVGDYFVRLPGRFLESEDLFFKTIAYRKELNAAAVRQSRTEGFTGADHMRRVKELINNPTKQMNESASARADYETFTQDPAIANSLFGNLAKSASFMTARHPSLKFVAPFIRTPSNIIRYGVENSMISPASKKWRDDFTAGGVKRDMALARLSLGTMATISIMNMYESGLITGGGPSDPASRRIMTQNMRWQPYSIKLGNDYYSFNRMDPMGLAMSMMATGLDYNKFAHSDDEVAMNMLEIIHSMGDSFLDKTFMTSFAEMMALANDPEGGVKASSRFGANIMAGYAPAWLTLVARSEDLDADGNAIKRDSSTFSKSYGGIWANYEKTLANRIPWSKEGLPAQRDWRGNIVTESGGGYGHEFFFLKKSTARDDAGAKALLDNWVAPPRPSQVQEFVIPEALGLSSIGVVSIPIDILDLDDNGGDVFEQFQVYVGRERGILIDDFVNSDKYQDMPDDMKGNNSIAATVLQSLLETGHQIGKTKFWADYNKLAKERGWRQFSDEDILRIVEEKHGKQGKVFPTPTTQSTTPQF